MKIKFLGPSGSELGYCALLRTASGAHKFLVDCGSGVANDAFGEEGACSLDFVVLTGPQPERCLGLPRLVAAGFDGSVYCMRFAADLARMNLHHAATLPGANFSGSDVDRLDFQYLDERPDFRFGVPIEIDGDITLSFQPTGTAGGACNVVIGWRSSDGDWDDIAFLGDQASHTAEDDAPAMLFAKPMLNQWPSYVVANTTFSSAPYAVNETRRKDRLADWSRVLRGAALQGGPVIVCLAQPDQLPEVLLDLHIVLEADLQLPGRSHPAQTIASAINVIVGSDFADQVATAHTHALTRHQSGGQQGRLYRSPELMAPLACKTEDELDEVIRRLFPEQAPSVSQFSRYTLLYEGATRWHLLPAGGRLEVFVVSEGSRCLANLGQDRLVQGLKSSTATVVLTDLSGVNPVARRLRAASRGSGTDTGGPVSLGDIELPLASLKAKIEDVGRSYATHASRDELVERILKRQAALPDHKPSCRVFINDADTIRARSLALFINERSRRRKETECIVEGIEVPDSKSGWFDLDLDRWMPDESPPIDEDMSSLLRRILAEQQRTNELFADILGGSAAASHP